MKTVIKIAICIFCGAGVNALAADDSYPKLGDCEKTWSNTDSLEKQLEAIHDYQDCIKTFKRDQLIAITTASGLSVVTAIESLDQTSNLERKVDEAEKKVKETQDFLGFNWGLGVGAAFGRGNSRVEEAQIVNDIVRVSKDVTDMPRIVLEMHNFIWRWQSGGRRSKDKDSKDKSSNGRTFGFGPFAAVNFGATGGDTLASFGGGLMLGIKRAKGSGSFNIGVGYMLDQDVKQLGADIVENQALPVGETEIRYRSSSEPALLVFVSTTFD